MAVDNNGISILEKYFSLTRDMHHIVYQKDGFKNILEEICKSIHEKLNVGFLWITLFDKDQNPEIFSSFGMDEFSEGVYHILKTKKYPAAIQKAITQKEFTVLSEPDKDCPLEVNFEQNILFIMPMIHDGSVVGLLCAGFPTGVQDDTIEQKLYKQLVSDFSLLISILKEKAGRESDLKYKNLINSLKAPVFIIQNGVIKYANPALSEISEYGHNELIGADFFTFIDPEESGKVLSHYSERIAGNESPELYESVAVSKSGKKIPVEVEILKVQYEGAPALQVMIRDISIHKATLAKIRESEERFRFLSEMTFEGIIIHKNGVVIDCNQSLLNMTGFEKEKVVGMNLLEMTVSDKERHKVQKNIVKESAKPYIITGVRKDGSTYQAEVEARNIELNGEELRIAAIRDVSERIQMQKEIDESQRKLETLMGNLPGMAYTCLNNPNWDMNYMSQGCIELLEYAPGELIDNPSLCYKDIILPEDQKYVWDEIQLAVEQNRSFELEYRIVTKNGLEKWVWEKGKLVNSGGKVFLEGFINDITFRKEAEKRIKEQEARYRAVFENTGTAMCILEDDGTISLANEQFEKLSGFSMDEIVHKMKWMDFVHPEDLEMMSQQHTLRRENKNLALTQYEFRFIDRDKTIKYIQLAVDMIPGINKSVASLSDISYRVIMEHRIKENEERLSSITSSAQDAIVLIDNNGEITFWNPAAEMMFGYSLEEVMGKNLHDIIAPEEYHAEHHKHFAKFRHSGEGNAIGKTLELKGKRMNGELFPVELSLAATKVEGKWGATGIIRDISDRKMSEALLVEKNRQLEEEKEKVMESDRLKSAFLATMSHELRTPLNHIIGFSDLIPDITADEQVKEFSLLINKGGNDLLNMIDDIFDLAMIEKTEVKIRSNEVKVRDIYMEIKRDLQETIARAGKQNKIIPDFSLDKRIVNQAIITDKPKIIQVISNLIRNAVKFTSQGYINLELGLSSGKEMFISVTDSGIGVPPEKHKMIFEFFRQGDDSHTRTYGGIGVGLALSQKIATAMNGEILLESEVGKGSVFTFKFPIEIATDSGEDEIIRSVRNKDDGLKGRTILVAEDDEASMELICYTLETMQCSYIKAKDGMEAVDAFNENLDIDLILMDLKMPNMDGFSATAHIKAKNPDMMIIALTAYSLEKDKQRALKAGCDYVMTKPVNLPELKQLMEQLIG